MPSKQRLAAGDSSRLASNRIEVGPRKPTSDDASVRLFLREQPHLTWLSSSSKKSSDATNEGNHHGQLLLTRISNSCPLAGERKLSAAHRVQKATQLLLTYVSSSCAQRLLSARSPELFPRLLSVISHLREIRVGRGPPKFTRDRDQAPFGRCPTLLAPQMALPPKARPFQKSQPQQAPVHQLAPANKYQFMERNQDENQPFSAYEGRRRTHPAPRSFNARTNPDLSQAEEPIEPLSNWYGTAMQSVNEKTAVNYRKRYFMMIDRVALELNKDADSCRSRN